VSESLTPKARVQLLGAPRLIDAAGKSLALPARASLLIVFILVSARDLTAPRSQVARFLWPDAPNASANLRQLLARLGAAQASVGIDFVRFDRRNVTLNVAGASIDLIEFQAALATLSWATCQAVIGEYPGDLLEGISVADNDLSSWLDVHRARIRNAMVAAFADLLETPSARANPRTAQAIASRLLEIDPYQEAAYRALMRAFAVSGLIDLVAVTFDRCREVIGRDLGTVPGQATIDLYRELTRDAAPALFAFPRPAGNSVPPSDLRATLPRLVILAPPAAGNDKTLVENATLVLDDTLVGLCSLRTVRIVAAHTAWELSGRLDDEAARRFNIGYTLETALRRRGIADLLSVHLFDTRTREIVWADTYPLSADALAGAHRGLSTAITVSLADAVERAEIARFEKDDNPQAYYWHLMGQKYLRYMDLPSVRRAHKAFRNAIAADPDFAPAFSGSARATQRQWLVLGRGDSDLLAEAEAIGTRAVSLDHRDARGYREVALCNLYRRRWDDSIAWFSEAERLAPQHADLISDFGDALGHAGEPEKGLQKVERAMELNPIPPDQYWWNAAGLHFQLRDYRAAIAAIERMGDPLPALRIAAAAWACLGIEAEARKCATKFLHSYPDFRVAQWLAIVPDRRPEDQRHYELGLKLAGFR